MQSFTFNIRDAKAMLSKLINIVLKGNEVILTKHGQTIAKIIKIKDEERPFSERLTKLENDGIIEKHSNDRKEISKEDKWHSFFCFI